MARSLTGILTGANAEKVSREGREVGEGIFYLHFSSRSARDIFSAQEFLISRSGFFEA